MYVEHKQWADAFALVERHPDLKENVYLPYANYLAEVRRVCTRALCVCFRVYASTVRMPVSAVCRPVYIVSIRVCGSAVCFCAVSVCARCVNAVCVRRALSMLACVAVRSVCVCMSVVVSV